MDILNDIGASKLSGNCSFWKWTNPLSAGGEEVSSVASGSELTDWLKDYVRMRQFGDLHLFLKQFFSFFKEKH